MDVVLLVTLRGEDEGLHEAPVRAVVVGEFAGHLDDDTIAEGGVRVDLPYLGAAVAEAEGHDALVDLLLPADGLLELAAAATAAVGAVDAAAAAAIEAAVDEGGVGRVEPVQVQRRLVQQRVVLPDKLPPDGGRVGSLLRASAGQRVVGRRAHCGRCLE